MSNIPSKGNIDEFYLTIDGQIMISFVTHGFMMCQLCVVLFAGLVCIQTSSALTISLEMSQLWR